MLQLIERGTIRAMPIRLSAVTAGPESVSPEVQVLRIGKFNHPKYGEFEIETATLQELKKNFDDKIRGVDIAVDYFHKSDEEAAGWIKELYLSEDESELWAKVDWTVEASKKLSEREIRYFSPDFAFKWTDPETEVTYNNVLFGGGLTNRPFVKDMAAIVATEQGDTMDAKVFKELQDKVMKLSEGAEDLAAKHADLQKAHADLLAKHGALQKKLDEQPKPAADDSEEEGEDDSEDEPKTLDEAKKMLSAHKAKLAEYAEHAKKAEEAKQMAEKETKFNVLLSEGKACVAQKDAFMKNDMEAFVKLSQPLNMNGKGSSANDNASGDREDRVLKLAEEKCKADPKLKLTDAIGMANREITK
jgi:phage I-like protein